jgi:hypothetical protein
MILQGWELPKPKATKPGAHTDKQNAQRCLPDYFLVVRQELSIRCGQELEANPSTHRSKSKESKGNNALAADTGNTISITGRTILL